MRQAFALISMKSFSVGDAELNDHSYLTNLPVVDQFKHFFSILQILQLSIKMKHADLNAIVNKASHHEEIFDTLDRAGCSKIAKRLRYLHSTVEDDDPEAPEIDLLSLQRFTNFFTCDDLSLPEPTIVVINQDGFLKAEWHSKKASALLNFQPNGKIIFAATLDDDMGDDSQDIYGTGTKELALRAVLPFINDPHDLCLKSL